jgi:hypothetical protein
MVWAVVHLVEGLACVCGIEVLTHGTDSPVAALENGAVAIAVVAPAIEAPAGADVLGNHGVPRNGGLAQFEAQ